MERCLEPEILDSLPHDHPDARHNRRDLRLTNAIMGNGRWFARTLPGLLRPDDRVLEIGAGTGELAARLRPFVPALDALDPWPAPPDWPSSSHWHQTTAEAFTGWNNYSVVIGNLIFHQFDRDTLQHLGRRIGDHARLLLLCEPARRRRFQWLFAAAAPLLGANYVSRHDGRVSIAAGFLGDELPRLLGLDPSVWQWRARTTALGACRVMARHTGR